MSKSPSEVASGSSAAGDSGLRDDNTIHSRSINIPIREAGVSQNSGTNVSNEPDVERGWRTPKDAKMVILTQRCKRSRFLDPLHAEQLWLQL